MPFDDHFRHAIEFRYSSWFDDETYDYLKANNLCMAWWQQDKLQTPPVITTDFNYLRLIGDRSIRDSEFGKMQKNRESELAYWAAEVAKLQKVKKLKRSIVAANNHYAGFGPGTVNVFRKMVNLPELTWHEMQEREKQPSLLDFRKGSGPLFDRCAQVNLWASPVVLWSPASEYSQKRYLRL